MENSSIFTSYQKYECVRGDKQFMLRNTIGRSLPYIVNFKKNTCQIFDIEWEKITHSYTFPDGCQLIDVDYFPTKEGQLGILLGLSDARQTYGHEHFVLALSASPDCPQLKITHSSKIPQKITTVKTLFSLADVAQRGQELRLFRRIAAWTHVVAVGCEQTSCHLMRLFEVDSECVEIRDRPKALMNLLMPFTTDGVFRYTTHEDVYIDYQADDVYVSALCLIPRSRTLLVGLSTGGILATSLNPSNRMMFLELRHQRPIRRIAPLEPEDDPDKFEYFITAVDRSPRHPIMIQLWRGSFRTFKPIKVEPELKYDEPFFTVCLEHKIPFGERWLAVNPIVSERSESTFGKNRSTGGGDSMLNMSHAYGTAKNRNSVLLAYEKSVPNGTSHVEAAIFDMDAWYYKRVPSKVIPDRTVLRQSPFLSCIKTDIPIDNVTDIGILTLDSTDVSRFSSLVSDADQLFYPSSLSYERVFVVEKTQIRWMKIQNVQETILSKCAAKLPIYFRYPETISGEILGAGLIRKSVFSPNSSGVQEKIDEESLTEEQKVVLSAMLYYGKVDELCKLASGNQLKESTKKEIGEWAVQEAIDFKRAIADKTVAVFQGSSSSLSPPAENTVIQGIKLFRVIYEYLKTCSKHVKLGGARMRNLAHSVKCMRNHTKLISRFIGFCIIPVDSKLQDKMRVEHEKRRAIAERNRSALPVQVSVRTMHRLAPDAQFWNDAPHDEWFPPTPVDLLESILNVNIPERVKREVVVQYIIDWLRVQDSEETQRALAIETIKVMTNQMLEVDLEKIYYLLDQEKAALEEKKTLTSSERMPEEEEEELSYVKLWNGDVPTMGADDLGRFEKRMRMQINKGTGRLPLIDRESEMMYQVYLFENEKYELMSKEAIESNKLLSMFLPGMVRKKGVKEGKTPKQIEIEASVKKMFELSEEKEGEEERHMFATLDGKWRLERANEWDGSTWKTDASYVPPPTAKRLSRNPVMGGSESKPSDEVDLDSTINSTVVDPDEPGRNEEINRLIATPAKYYKRPMVQKSGRRDPLSIDTEFSGTSPDGDQPRFPAQNSILKTAKAIQSPGRGRIRFHESVRRGVDESVEMTEETQDEEGEKEEEEAPPKPLDFSILNEEDEEAMMTTRRRESGREEVKVEEEEEEEECEEMEKSFEDQEDEDDEDVETSDESNEDVESPESSEIPQTENISEPQNASDSPVEVVKDDVAPPESAQPSAEDVEDFSTPQGSERADSDSDSDNDDGVEKTFEVQEDEDVEPVEQDEGVDVFHEVQEELDGASDASDAPGAPEKPEDTEKPSRRVAPETAEAPESADTPEEPNEPAVPVEESFEIQLDEHSGDGDRGVSETDTSSRRSSRLSTPTRSGSPEPTASRKRSSETPSEDTPGPSEPKRGRGRPSKASKLDSVPEESVSVATTTPRPRGRPKKVVDGSATPSRQSSVAPSTSAASDPTTPSREASVASTSSAVTSKKRGRPRKDQNASETVGSATTTPSREASVASTSSATTSKKRGRPKKDQSASETVGSATPRPRGRPKKVRKEDGEEEDDDDDDEEWVM